MFFRFILRYSKLSFHVNNDNRRITPIGEQNLYSKPYKMSYKTPLVADLDPKWCPLNRELERAVYSET